MTDKIIIGINARRLLADRQSGIARVVRYEPGASRPEILATFPIEKLAKAYKFAERYVARFGHCELRDPLYIGPTFTKL